MIGSHAHPEWMSRGKCNGLDPNLFFPERGDTAAVQKAMAVCSACAVREECLQWAIENMEKHGIWGGTSERSRRSLRREWKADAA